MEFSREYAYKVSPSYLKDSIDIFLQDLSDKEQGKPNTLDCTITELSSSINVAEVEQEISSDLAGYMRKEYLGYEKDEL